MSSTVATSSSPPSSTASSSTGPHRYLVVGGNSKVGRAIVHQLSALGLSVRTTVRKVEEGRARQLAQLPNVEVVQADLFDYEALRQAATGMQRAYFVPVTDPYVMMSAVAFATAVREAGVSHVVLLSQWLSSPRSPAPMTRQQWLVDQLFMHHLPGVTCTIINPGYFADNYLRVLPTAVHGELESKNCPPSNEDIARVAVAALCDPARHAGKTYRPTGPQVLSGREMVAVIEKTIGKRVWALPLPSWLLFKAARKDGSPIYEQANLQRYLQDHKQGAFAFGGPTTDVLDVTGTEAESFATTVMRYADRPECKDRSLKRKLKEFAAFMALPMLPGYNIKAYEKRMSLPAISNAKYAMEDDTWKATHGGSKIDGGSRGSSGRQ